MQLEVETQTPICMTIFREDDLHEMLMEAGIRKLEDQQFAYLTRIRHSTEHGFRVDNSSTH